MREVVAQPAWLLAMNDLGDDVAIHLTVESRHGAVPTILVRCHGEKFHCNLGVNVRSTRVP